MEISIERVENEDEYMVRVDNINNRFTRTTTYAKSESHTKQWVQHIQRIYRLKLRRRNLVVSLSADRSFNYAKGRSLLTKAKVAKKMEKDHGWLMPKLVELRELAAQRNNVINFSHCSLAKFCQGCAWRRTQPREA
ncbi:hypothetical protein TIFTF001_010490 [Ficus carica]|uniref:Uncharacterized protein n=1 Tax=Ficus carica TaxID=3494 RepID=A0AA87ZXG5_FICCA|nr:hypothetical protein TIFTF001_010490 [Ficus carica]